MYTRIIDMILLKTCLINIRIKHLLIRGIREDIYFKSLKNQFIVTVRLKSDGQRRSS